MPDPTLRSIGVRCSSAPFVLWVRPVDGLVLRTKGPNVVISPRASRFEALRLTDTGQALADTLLGITGLVEASFMKPDVVPGGSEVALTIDDRSSDQSAIWRQILPPVVAAIRSLPGNADLEVSVIPPNHQDIPVWHRELLEELFGPLAE